MKLCECGCGQHAPIARKTDARRGVRAGEPLRFIQGHYGKVQPVGAVAHRWRGGRQKSQGYVLIHEPDHPRSNGRGYVFEHVLVASGALGRTVPPTAEVHHVNGDKADNRSANLVICQGREYHRLLHVRTTALAETGDPNKRRCTLCKEHDDVRALRRRHGQNCYVHPACQRAYRRDYYRQGGAA